MKLPNFKLGLPFTIATAVYLLFSLLGSMFYFVLPPVLCSAGARIHAYLLIEAALQDPRSAWQIALAVVGHLGVLLMAVMGIAAILKGPSKLYCLLVALDIVLCALFLLTVRNNEYHDTQGILLNIAYFIWLTRQFTPKKPAAPVRKGSSTKQKGK